MKLPINFSIKRTQRGVSLVELMIGLVLGLIASLAIFSITSTFETQRRTTGSGVDMQQNGLLALYSVEQDIGMAGFGLIDSTTTPGGMPCSRINAYSPASVYISAPVMLSSGSAGTDIITINRLNSDTGGIVTGGQAAKLTATLSAPGTVSVDSNAAINPNDFVLISQPGLDCTILKVTATTSTNSMTVAYAGNAGGDTTQTPGAFPNYTAGAVFVNLGPTVPSNTAGYTPSIFGTSDTNINPRFSTTKYQINSSYELIRSDDGGGSWNTVASNIVSVAAQYGVANPGSQSVSCWTDAVGNACSGTNWASPSTTEVKRIKAIRVAIVARSAQKTTCNNVAPIWFGGQIDISGIADSACYRYKIYQTIIPVRNVIWGNL